MSCKIMSTSFFVTLILVVGNHPLGYAETSEIYVTLDKGQNWKRMNVPFELSGSN